jgi:hypothetical protein
MRSKSPISSNSNLGARKSGIPQEADKSQGLFGGPSKKEPSTSALFGKPPPSDLMRESPAFGSAKTQENPAASLFGGKVITDKPADKDQPGICKPKPQVVESATKTSGDALFKQPEPPKRKTPEDESSSAKIGKQSTLTQAPSGSLFGGKPESAGASLFSSSAGPKKTQGAGFASGTAASALFGGGAGNDSSTKPSAEQTASSSNIKENKAAPEPAANPFLSSSSQKSNPFLNAGAKATGSPFGGGKPATPASTAVGAAQGATGASGFGGATSTPPAGGSLFGGPAPASGGLFGSASQSKPDAAAKPTGSLFGGGGAPATGSLFGGAPSSKPTVPGSLFGGPPA